MILILWSQSTKNSQGFLSFLVNEHIELPRLMILSGGMCIVTQPYDQIMTLPESGCFCQKWDSAI